MSEHEVMEEPHAPSPPPFQPPTVDQLLAQLEASMGYVPSSLRGIIGGMGQEWIGWIICRINDIPQGTSSGEAWNDHAVSFYNELCAAEITSSQRSAIWAAMCMAAIKKTWPPDIHNREGIGGAVGLFSNAAYHSVEVEFELYPEADSATIVGKYVQWVVNLTSAAEIPLPIVGDFLRNSMGFSTEEIDKPGTFPYEMLQRCGGDVGSLPTAQKVALARYRIKPFYVDETLSGPEMRARIGENIELYEQLLRDSGMGEEQIGEFAAERIRELIAFCDGHECPNFAAVARQYAQDRHLPLADH